jgi:hypothetical protein
MICHQLGPEQRQLFDRADAAADLHLVADPEGPEDQQHNARRQVGERALQGEPDRRAGGADDGDEARRLDAELRQHREQSDGQDQVARQAAEEALQRRVEMRRPRTRAEPVSTAFRSCLRRARQRR